MTEYAESIIIPRDEVSAMAGLSNRNEELLGYYLAERTSQGLRTIDSIFVAAADNNTGSVKEQDRQKFKQFVNDYLTLARRDPRFAVLASHVHSRRFGDRIQSDDPYWSINGRNAGLPLNTIVDRKFYISGRGGDDTAFESEHTKYGIQYHLFFHPAPGSEGQIMTHDKVMLTAFKYDPSRLGKVRETEVEIR